MSDQRQNPERRERRHKNIAHEDRVLPSNLEAERSVLGAIILHNSTYERIGNGLDSADFFRDAHRRVYEAIAKILERPDGIVDLVTLKEELGRRGDLEEVGGPVYIASLVDGVPRNTSIESYVAIVREKATLRRLISSSHRILEKAYEAEEPASVILGEADRRIIELQQGSQHGRMISLEHSQREFMADIMYRMEHKGELTGITTGFPSINEITMGWQASDMIIIGARPSIGKTAFILNSAFVGAETPRIDGGSNHVAIFSMEMRRRQLEYRLLSAVTGIQYTRLLGGYVFGAEETARITEGMHRMASAPFHIDDATSRTVWDVRTICRRLRSEHGLGLVIIDYVQLMAGSLDRRGATRNEEVTDISRRLKTLADELGVPMIVLSQLNRANAARPDPTPKLSDLRESGSLEQDADIVAFLHRRNHKESGLTKFIIEKARNVATGVLNLSIDRDIQRFTEFEGEEPAPPEPTADEKTETTQKAIRRRRARIG